MEEWRDVPGYEGFYQISISTKEGKCRSLYKNHELSNKPSQRDKRISWVLFKDNKGLCKQSACWIALTYPELVQNEYFPGAEIDHVDTDRLNNHPSNLKWVTHKDNLNNPLTRQHKSAAKMGHRLSEDTKKKIAQAHLGKKQTEEHKQKSAEARRNIGKWVIKLSPENEILHFYPTARLAAQDNQANYKMISGCCLGKRKTHAGFIWKFAE